MKEFLLKTITTQKIRKIDLENLLNILIEDENYEFCILVKELINIKHYDNDNMIIKKKEESLKLINELKERMQEMAEMLGLDEKDMINDSFKISDDSDIFLVKSTDSKQDLNPMLIPSNISDRSKEIFLEIYNNYSKTIKNGIEL